VVNAVRLELEKCHYSEKKFQYGTCVRSAFAMFHLSISQKNTNFDKNCKIKPGEMAGSIEWRKKWN
jgi:hypothetical protein